MGSAGQTETTGRAPAKPPLALLFHYLILGIYDPLCSAFKLIPRKTRARAVN